ncbi:Speckle-type POZ protein [Hordeum vulgare]|nr:Speckle-type POZ protein [Hordeum vulgare]
MLCQMDKGKEVVSPLDMGNESSVQRRTTTAHGGSGEGDNRVTLDQGWATFAAVHQVRIGYVTTFMLLTWNTMMVIVFNDDGMELVTKCKKPKEALAMTA